MKHDDFVSWVNSVGETKAIILVNRARSQAESDPFLKPYSSKAMTSWLKRGSHPKEVSEALDEYLKEERVNPLGDE